MDTEANKALVRRFIQEVYAQLRPETVDELVADDFVSHRFPPSVDGKRYLRESTGRMAKALAEIRFTIHDMIAEDDRVAVRLTASARPIGEFMGMPPTGKSYEIGEMHMYRLRDGKIVEHWHELDAMGMMSQLQGDSG